MSEAQHNPEEIDTREGLVAEDEAVRQLEALANGEDVIQKTELPQAREVILPVIMRKGEDIAVLGDAVFNPETSKMVVSFNTQPGRDIAEFIGSGMLSALSFQGHMSKQDFTR